jgi:hypothetical protein
VLKWIVHNALAVPSAIVYLAYFMRYRLHPKMPLHDSRAAPRMAASDLLLEAPKLKRSKAKGPGIFQQQPACAMSYLGWLSVKQFSFFTVQGQQGHAHVLIWSNSDLRLF